MSMTIDRGRLKEHLISWATGTPLGTPPPTATGTLVLADAAHIPAVVASGLVGPGTLLLAPDDGTGVPEPAVGYDGSLTEAGGEFSNGQDFFLQTHSYVASPFMTVFGPTLVRVLDEADHEAFLADAARAVDEGVFPDFLVTSSVVLADPAALSGEARPGDGPAVRLYADHDGQLSVSPTGAVLGTVGDSLETLTARHEQLTARAAGLGQVLSPDTLDTVHDVHPHLPRYLRAVTALRSFAARGITGLKVSGFGSRLAPQLAGTDARADLSDPGLPLVVYRDDEAYIVDGTRLFTVDVRAAQALECLLATGGRTAGLVPDGWDAQVTELLARHGVRLSLPVAA
ncbi:daptide biosynthesis RiPP recognition protein [Streptomyces abyssomicinicus]|uniref:daptide biosynthesis RiPP recognition protein n=1 Tax=Streptomyces abyssomicinicus TaxID=574929 RepID=UPI00124FFDDB|nr:daptide biosynthesis RiPP recognition protein [Streptomyces abyssomicinicus]